MILNCNITSTICNSVRNLFVRHNRKNIGNNFTAMLPCYILPIPQRRTNILSINRFKNINLLQNENETKLRTNVIQLRGKKSKSLSQEYESDSDSDDETIEIQPGSKVIQIQVESLRWDLILKHAFSISRNKLQVLFYESKIRLNGEKILKKSQSVKLGDEIDVIKEVSKDNPELITVSRVEVLKAKPFGDIILITIRKHKSLLIENYKNAPWEENASPVVTEL